MSTKQSTVDYLLDQLNGAGGKSFRAKKMFGEYCLYAQTKPVALVCDDQLFVKPTDAGKVLICVLQEAPPYPGAKLHLLVSPDLWEDGEWLNELLSVTAAQLPEPKPKAAKPKKPKL